MTAYIFLGLVGAALIARWVWDQTAGWRATRRDTRDFQASAREAAKASGIHPAGKQRQVHDQETDPPIPPSVEVRDHGRGKSVADAADADYIRLHLEATWAMPAVTSTPRVSDRRKRR